MYYRGQGVRMASVKRKTNTSPTSWCIGSFDRVLPGSASVVQGGTDVQTSQDLRPFVSRGDPIKVGPQLFIVSTDLRRPFTSSTLPLDTSTSWISVVDGTVHSAPGKLLGPTHSQVMLYTCDITQFPYNTWTGPRGGAVGYWDDAGKWHAGDCPGKCPQWYSPLFLGPGGKQVNGPSPGTLAKVKHKTSEAQATANNNNSNNNTPTHQSAPNNDDDADDDDKFLNTRSMQLQPPPHYQRQPPPQPQYQYQHQQPAQMRPPPMMPVQAPPAAPPMGHFQPPPPPPAQFMPPPPPAMHHMQYMQPPPPPPPHAMQPVPLPFAPPPPPMQPVPPPIPGFTKHLF